MNKKIMKKLSDAGLRIYIVGTRKEEILPLSWAENSITRRTWQHHESVKNILLRAIRR